MTAIILGIVVIAIIIFIISVYNSLNVRSNQIQNAFSSLDALFIKRTELIPNLVTIVKQYTNYEKDVLEKITQLRQLKADTTEYKADSEASQMMKQIMLQVENYPDLRANTQFLNLQYSWTESEEQIAAGRRYLSASITDYNNRLSTFPGNVIGSKFGFKKHEWQMAAEAQRQNVNAEELFNK
ncbi:LemA family protein [Flavobacterium johnsoniae]|uniref:LemA family protein n=1 Tax=Flavobacterium johnsoniae (strain ATCC 17061 / DSM 2064 / JCM 8514 / BCRC 14874 / CCUG 350202 / NBRC 14942 / NCIMB 11054 / UW101) TaxID=376686 RepID=A5FIQ1_FLAJ1|nr:LemA family protein [Flavobacterium johnsoniae]ABQ04914.1 LemA family protein [Flavobacterium johnsoniae UW101]OXG02887.1 LemA family protein [Flavobacterium johnsoniae UW101]WQG83288.1 LemA family protein [Flavobacterium johnsoniae UW101]SHK38766.1 LemA protein [Flavobacterium johnsoniae]